MRTFQPVEPGEPGELCIGGVGVARGYLKRPDLTEQKFVPNPFANGNGQSPRLYRSGDLVRITADGEIDFLGRIDRQVKIRGFRIELSEIESVLHDHPKHQQALVEVFEREDGMKELAAFVVPQADCVERLVRSRQRAGRAPRTAAGLHGARLSRFDRRDPDAAQRQSRPVAACRSRAARWSPRAKWSSLPRTSWSGRSSPRLGEAAQADVRFRVPTTSLPIWAAIRCWRRKWFRCCGASTGSTWRFATSISIQRCRSSPST